MKAEIEQKTLSAKEIKNAYLRAWRARKRERVREYNRRYWLRVAEKLEQGEKEGGAICDKVSGDK